MDFWRAVDEPERLDIEKSGRFRLNAGGAGLKYFALERIGAEREAVALMTITGSPCLWLTCAKGSAMITGMRRRRFTDASPFGPVEAVALDAADLRKLGPARIIGLVGKQ